jgi:hypothetical protein
MFKSGSEHVVTASVRGGIERKGKAKTDEQKD